MAKDKKSKKGTNSDGKLELIAGPSTGAGKKGKKSGKGKEHHGLDGLMKLADHPLLGDLLAVGALAAVAAIAESGKDQSAKTKSREAVKAAGKAAAAAIGARLLKEVAAGGKSGAKATKPTS